MKRVLLVQKECAEPMNVLSRHVSDGQHGQSPWARVAGAGITAPTEREGKGRTIPFIHFKANIFVVFHCIVCLHGKKNSQLFLVCFLKSITPFSCWTLRKEYCKTHVFFQFWWGFFPSVYHSVDRNVLVWLLCDAYCLLWQVLLWSTSLTANLQTPT